MSLRLLVLTIYPKPTLTWTKLSDKKCVPCEGGVIPFDISEIHKYQKKVDGWSIVDNEKMCLIDFYLNVLM